MRADRPHAGAGAVQVASRSTRHEHRAPQTPLRIEPPKPSAQPAADASPYEKASSGRSGGTASSGLTRIGA